VKAMGIKEVLSAPRSPGQRAYVERVIGTIRRECLDHMIVLNEASPYRHLRLTCRIITNPGRTSRWPKTHRNRGRAPAGTRSRGCHTASWRSSPPLRTPRSLNVAVLASIPIQGRCADSRCPTRQDFPLFANRSIDFPCFSISSGVAWPEQLICSRYAPAASGCRWDLR